MGNILSVAVKGLSVENCQSIDSHGPNHELQAYIIIVW